MSEATLVELSLRTLALGLAAYGARISLSLAGRIHLHQALYAGTGAVVLANLEVGFGVLASALVAVSVTATLGALLGAFTSSLAPARAAAFGLALQVGGTTLGPRLPATGGHMGLMRPPARLEFETLAWTLAIFGILGLASWWVSGTIPAKRITLRLRMLFQAPSLSTSLGFRAWPAIAGLEAVVAGLGAASGVVFALSLDHLHASSFGLPMSFDALAAGLLGHRVETILLAALGLTLLDFGMAGAPAARTFVLGTVLFIFALRYRRP